ncbi:hypothetical protein ABZ490_07325 [Streptomyces sp. NPDC005811]|uniref:hypothetical protein n=1 Tax=Streptomyces sp. NPDC005811 TaxID=3154565 RepID=UPI0034071C85
MGDRFQVIVDLDVREQDAPRLAEQLVERLVTDGIVLAEREGFLLGAHPPGPHWHRAAAPDPDGDPTDGLAVHLGRGVFHSGADIPEHAVCPHCHAHTPLDTDGWTRVGAAVAAWSETGAADLACPRCTASAPIPEWTWDNAPLAFGHLGLKFWNWPDLGEEFQAHLTALLDGHRTAYLWGKL